jgi:ABC-type glutathione transport system ATPase component
MFSTRVSDSSKQVYFEDKKPINYVAFISFKIKNGEIIAIIP